MWWFQIEKTLWSPWFMQKYFSVVRVNSIPWRGVLLVMERNYVVFTQCPQSWFMLFLSGTLLFIDVYKLSSTKEGPSTLVVQIFISQGMLSVWSSYHTLIAQKMLLFSTCKVNKCAYRPKSDVKQLTCSLTFIMFTFFIKWLIVSNNIFIITMYSHKFTYKN